MTGVVVVDANLMVLLVVGAASKNYIARHKRLRNHYTVYDFELLGLLVAEFSDIVVLPHILAEVSNIARQIDGPARAGGSNCAAHADLDGCRASDPKHRGCSA